MVPFYQRMGTQSSHHPDTPSAADPFGSTSELNAAASALLSASSPPPKPPPTPGETCAKYQRREEPFILLLHEDKRWQSPNPRQEEKRTHTDFVLCCSERRPATQISTEPSGGAATRVPETSAKQSMLNSGEVGVEKWLCKE